MRNIYNEETPFYSRKKVDFLLAAIDIFMDFLILEKKKTEMCSADSCRSSILKKEQEKESKKLDCPVHKIKKCKKKDKILLECVVSTSTAKHMLKGVLVTKGKLKPDVNSMSDILRDEQYVDNNIYVSSLMNFDMKNINRKVL